MENHLNKVMSKTEINSLLGKPDSDYQYNDSKTYYEYNFNGPGLISFTWLKITFDGKDKVLNFEVIKD